MDKVLYSDILNLVDSIRWVRQNCILLGCFQLIADMEENYLVQVIRSPDGKITDGSSNLVALSFSDLFPCSMDDLVPAGVGPHLLFSYFTTRRNRVIERDEMEERKGKTTAYMGFIAAECFCSDSSTCETSHH
ncbi:Uncharacterized protein Rs2_38969 [Raphanus sativus]|nr:Uncharacterized protein Rs2_38969 [Raphanus sativus]